MFLGLFQSKDIAVDLGTSNTVIYVRGQGIVLDESSVVAVRLEDGAPGKKTLLAVGRQAKAMLGKVPGNLMAVRPMKDGVIADFALAQLMLQEFIRQVQPVKSLFRAPPRMVICVPSDSTQVERRAIRDSALATGAKEVFLLEEAMAAALGAGLPVTDATGSMVVDIGGGTTEVAIIALGGMVYKDSIRIGGNKFDEAIMAYMRKNRGVLIGETTAETIKKTLGLAFPSSEVREIEVCASIVSTGVPRSLRVSSKEIFEALTEPLGQIIQLVKNCLENTPPELVADISTKGLLMTGGGALLRDLDLLLMQETGIPVLIAQDPLTCVARGCGMTVDRLDESARLFS